MIEHLQQWLISWDRATFFAINNGWKSDFFDVVMPRISDLGLGHVQVAAILLTAICLSLRADKGKLVGTGGIVKRTLSSQKRWLIPVLLAWAIGGLTSSGIKAAVSRDRPWWFYVREHKLGRELEHKVALMPSRPPIRVRGFPSGHSATSVAILFSATLLFPRSTQKRCMLIVGWVVTLAICVSRIYISDHWPLDVLGGALVGVLSGTIAVLCTSRKLAQNLQLDGVNSLEPLLPPESVVAAIN